MPLQYELDEAGHRILVTSQGAVSISDTLATIDRQAADGAWSYATLYDARADVYVPSAEDIYRLVQHIGALTTKYGPRGPVALVMLNPELLQMGRRYARLSDLTALTVGLFTTIEEAEVWLAHAHDPSL